MTAKRLVVVALLLAAGSQVGATASYADPNETEYYPQSLKMIWRPTDGYLIAEKNASGEKSINVGFWFKYGINTDGVRYREKHAGDVMQPSQGTLEIQTDQYKWSNHEQVASDEQWCRSGNFDAVWRSMGTHSYKDDVSPSPGEIAFGMAGVDVAPQTWYGWMVTCDGPAQANDVGMRLYAQIGHCWLNYNCTALNVFSDDGQTLIPHRLAQLPANSSVKATFSNNPSFESGKDPWTTSGGSSEVICGNNAFAGSCFVRVVPNSSITQTEFQYKYDPPDAALSAAAITSGATVRCTTVGNDHDCLTRLRVVGYNSNDQVTDTKVRDWDLIPLGNSWWFLPPIDSGPFPDNTDYWKIQVQTWGDNLDVDWNQQSWNSIK